MIIFMILMLIPMFISSMLIILNNYIYMKNLKFREKLNPFECGFESMTLSRNMFSLQFFLFTVIYLIFDIEIIIIIPSLLMMNCLNLIFFYIIIFLFILFFLSLYFEWMDKTLIWFK